MKILVVSSYLPYPLFSGGQVRLYNILKNLSKNHEITLICEKRNHQTERDVEEIKKICKKVLVVQRRKQWSFSNILKTGFSTQSFLITGHTSSDMKKLIKDEIESRDYDLIHVETSYVLQNLPKTSLPIVLVEHNVEYMVYKKYADKAPLTIKPLLYFDVLKLKKQEEVFWRTVTKLVAVSEAEKIVMKRKDTVVVPNGVDTDKFSIDEKLKKEKKELTVLFIGDFKWMQNRDSAEFILTKIWPKIDPKLNAKLKIVGKHIPDNIKALKKEGVLFDENAFDTVEVYRKADILLAPIRIGGGTSFKILEAMASGVCVITTDLGTQGLGAISGKHVLVGNTEEEIVSKLELLLTNENLRKDLIISARKFVEEKYDWKKIVNVLESLYKSLKNG
jgi:glycosyltransferase involved in cell wall biosynthesis